LRHIERRQPNRAERVKNKPGAGRKASSLEEALLERRMPEVRNLATRFLCTHQSPGEELPPGALDEAKANLRNFALVGIQERFDESVVILQRKLGLGPVPYRKRHVASATRKLSDDELALIEEHNRLDIELYAFGVQLFEQVFATSTDGMEADVEQLRANCEAAETAYRGEHRHLIEWLDRELPRGASRPVREIRAMAEAAGISMRDLKRAKALARVRRERPDSGPAVWTRPPED
jgi:hypothetical protein